MKIGIDIDGVLTDEHSFVLDYGTKFFYNNKIPYAIHRNIYDDAKIFDVTEEQYEEFWDECIFNYSEKISIRPFASEIINKFKEENNEIYIITSCSFTTYENEYKEKMQNIVKQWLYKNNVPYDEIIFSDNKVDICKENNIDVMIEDKPENIVSISKEIKVICYDNPYNEDLCSHNIIRCYSWYDIYEKINDIKK